MRFFFFFFNIFKEFVCHTAGISAIPESQKLYSLHLWKLKKTDPQQHATRHVNFLVELRNHPSYPYLSNAVSLERPSYMVFGIKHFLKFPMLAMAFNSAMRKAPQMKEIWMMNMFFTNIIFPNAISLKLMLSALSLKVYKKLFLRRVNTTEIVEFFFIYRGLWL